MNTICYFDDIMDICVGYQQGPEQFFYPNCPKSMTSGYYILPLGYNPLGQTTQQINGCSHGLL